MAKILKNKTTKNNLITILGLIVIYVAVMICNGAGLINNHIGGLLVPFCVYSTMAVSLNIIVGILGDLSLGHAGFMCIGAFTSAYFSKAMAQALPMVPRFIIAVIIGALAAALFGFLIGIPVLRLHGDYLAIVTLAFGEIIKNIINALYIGHTESGSFMMTVDISKSSEIKDKMLNGPQGITGIPVSATFTAGFIILLLAVLVTLNLTNSRSGRAIMSIRDNRIASESLGINVTKYKMLAFTISAAIAGCAGALYAHNSTILQAKSERFGYNMSIMILVYVVLGGIGSTRGSIIAAVVLTLIPEVLRFIGNYRMLIYAVIMIAMMIINWNPKSRAFIEKHNPFKKKEKEVE